MCNSDFTFDGEKEFTAAKLSHYETIRPTATKSTTDKKFSNNLSNTKKYRTNVKARVEYNPVHLLSNYPIDSSHQPNSTSAHQQQKKRAISNSLEEAWSTDQLPSGTK